MDSRLFPLKQGFFGNEIEPIIEKNYIWKGRPQRLAIIRYFVQ
jgi:hypothetical protein